MVDSHQINHKIVLAIDHRTSKHQRAPTSHTHVYRTAWTHIMPGLFTCAPARAPFVAMGPALADLGGRHRTCASYRDSSQDLSLSLKSHQHHRRIVSPPVSRRSASLPRVRPAFNAHAYDICAWYGSTLAQVPRCAALPRAPLNRRRSCAPRSRVRAPPTKLPLRRLSQSPPPPPPRPSPRVW